MNKSHGNCEWWYTRGEMTTASCFMTPGTCLVQWGPPEKEISKTPNHPLGCVEKRATHCRRSRCAVHVSHYGFPERSLVVLRVVQLVATPQSALLAFRRPWTSTTAVTPRPPEVLAHSAPPRRELHGATLVRNASHRVGTVSAALAAWWA